MGVTIWAHNITYLSMMNWNSLYYWISRKSLCPSRETLENVVCTADHE